MTPEIAFIVAAFVAVLQFCGLIAAVQAVLPSRTSQGAIAWGGALITMPVVALPLWLVLGRSRFNGVVNARRAHDGRLTELTDQVSPELKKFVVPLGETHFNARVLSHLAQLSFLSGNATRLLVDGEQTFAAIFAAIDRAQTAVVSEFFIVNDDQLGRQFQQCLIRAAQRGCDVYLLYDEIGSQRITKSFLAELAAGGVNVSGMRSTKGFFNKFQLNFRNHRKIVVVDGQCALIGGLNVGDEYIHRAKRLTPWRDTHMQIDGPAALAAQLTFVEDWLWATGDVPQLPWAPKRGDDDQIVFVLPSGPDDEFETCGLFFTHLINTAKRRIWIASPYFVPDTSVVTALQLAAMRGVDVRVLIPGMPDKWLVKQAALSYIDEVAAAGVKMYEYGEGFLHQKVAVVDDQVSLIGTANFDNRSFRLNFEISAVTIDQDFNTEVAAMLEQDFEHSALLDPSELKTRGRWFVMTTRMARLFSPIL